MTYGFRNESDRMAYLGDAYKQAAECARRIEALESQEGAIVEMTLSSELAEAARLADDIAAAERHVISRGAEDHST